MILLGVVLSVVHPGIAVRRRSATAVGAVCGVTGTAAGVDGPPLALALPARRTPHAPGHAGHVLPDRRRGVRHRARARRRALRRAAAAHRDPARADAGRARAERPWSRTGSRRAALRPHRPRLRDRRRLRRDPPIACSAADPRTRPARPRVPSTALGGRRYPPARPNLGRSRAPDHRSHQRRSRSRSAASRSTVSRRARRTIGARCRGADPPGSPRRRRRRPLRRRSPCGCTSPGATRPAPTRPRPRSATRRARSTTTTSRPRRSAPRTDRPPPPRPACSSGSGPPG